MADDRRLLERFVRLCEIPSPTGNERAVADEVLAELRELGVEASEDGAADRARAGAGNLIARVPGTSEECSFCVRTSTPSRTPRRSRSCARTESFEAAA